MPALPEPEEKTRYRLLCERCVKECKAIDAELSKRAAGLSDEDLIEAIRNCEFKIYHLTKDQLMDLDIVMSCIEMYEGEDIDDDVWMALKYLCERVSDDEEFLEMVAEEPSLTSYIYPYLPLSLRLRKDLALRGAGDVSYEVLNVPAELFQDKAFAFEWIKRGGEREAIPEEMLAYEDIAKALFLRELPRSYVSPLSGEEIMKELGIPPGKQVGELLEKLKAEILSGRVKYDHDGAMAYLKSVHVRRI